MEIFKIKDNQVERQLLTAEVPTGEQEETRTEAQELRDAQEMTGEKVSAPTGQTGSTEDGAEVKGPDSFTLGGQPITKGTVLKVDGPLSRIFTDSLNKILAVENMSMVSMTMATYADMLKEQEEAGEAPPEVIHVQAYDANELTNGDVVDISNQITGGPEEDHIVVTESARGISSSSDMLHRLCKSTATKDYVKMKTAVETVAARIIGKRA